MNNFILNNNEGSLTLIIGDRGIGKTYNICKFIPEYINFNKDVESKNILIYDPSEEYDNDLIKRLGFDFETKRISSDDILKLSNQKRNEVRRVLRRDENGNLLNTHKDYEIINKIINNFKKGLIILEDVSHNFDIEFCDLIDVKENKNLDVFITYYEIFKVNEVLLEKFSNIVMFHHSCELSRYIDKLPLFIREICLISEKIINYKYYTQKHKRFHVFIDKISNKIHGNFDIHEFSNACLEYISESYNSDKKIDLNDLVNKYYGNED